MESILLVEDREGLRQVYADFLKTRGYPVREVGSVEDAKTALEKTEFSLILTDYMLPGQNGLEFLEYLNNRDGDYVVVIMTAFGEVKLAVEAMRKGAFDFLEKPIDLEYLDLVISRALKHRRLERENDFRESRKADNRTRIVGDSTNLRQSLALAEKVAVSDTNVLLLGESGVGKELFARFVHEKSKRLDMSMVSINCASIPHDLMESELFGHEKGAFTGAVARKLGLIEVADGGTVFLDEIGELPLELQPKLLRVLQSKEFFRVGGNRSLSSDIRVVCATNRDLKQGIREGWFREDLYYRLAVFPIEIPPLRERKEDLEALCAWFLERRSAPPMSPELMARIKQYHWPGNVRELENVLERAIILSGGQELETIHFPEEIFRQQGMIPLDFQINSELPYKDNLDLMETALEKAFIKLLLKEERGRREPVARRMGISVKTLYNKIKAFGLET